MLVILTAQEVFQKLLRFLVVLSPFPFFETKRQKVLRLSFLVAVFLLCSKSFFLLVHLQIYLELSFYPKAFAFIFVFYENIFAFHFGSFYLPYFSRIFIKCGGCCPPICRKHFEYNKPQQPTIHSGQESKIQNQFS